MSDVAAIGIDVGGTNVRAGVVDADGRILEQLRTSTPDDGAQRLATMIDLVEQIRYRKGVIDAPVGVGAAGLVDTDGVMRYAPNLDWRDAPVQAELAAALHVPVLVENDANAAAWGEYQVGAARDATGGAVMLTLGTGVGGGLVMNGRLIRGAGGIGGEFGHVIIGEGGPLCPCGNRGCLEAYASGTAIGRRAREAVDAGQDPDSTLHALTSISGSDVTRAARAGDQLATRVLADAGRWLGVGIASLVNALDPEVVIIGGGALAAGALLLDPAVDAYRVRVVARHHRRVPPVVHAQLGDDAGLIGAALLAVQDG